jgi:O-antigen/teichoic acid export membrane protein
MSRLKWNIAANYFGVAWTAAVNILAVPLYVKFMGIESFGLVGFFTMLIAACSILDIGLHTTISRELARMDKLERKEESARDLVRTLEVISWAVAALNAVVVCSLAPSIAAHWLRPEQLSQDTVEKSIMLMGLAMALGHPYTLYNGGLLGLQKQVLANWINVAFATVRCIGAVLILWLVSPTIEAYLLWQIPVFLARTIGTALCLQRSLPNSSSRARFRKEHLASFWRFSLGVSGAAVLALILEQADKIVLSTLLTLEMFGYYSLAWTLAFSLVGLTVEPIRDAAFPRFSQYTETGNAEALKNLYHLTCQAAASVLLSVTVITFLYAGDILLIWTGNAYTAQNTSTLLQFLIIGMALRGLTTLPTALQFSYGWIRLTIGMNLAAVVVFVPLVVILTSARGAAGAAASWIFLYSGYMIAGITLMHRRIMKGEQKAWYLIDCGLPLCASLTIGCVSLWLAPLHASVFSTLPFLALVLLSAIAASTYSAPDTRHWVKHFVMNGIAFLSKRLRDQSTFESPKT